MSEMPAAEKQYILEAMPGFDDQLLKVLWETMTKNGGLQAMDRDVLKAFYVEFEKRPGLLESMTNESRRRKNMRLTESQLRKRIRKAILEANNDPHDYIDPTGIRIRHGNIGGANSDFKKHGGPSRMISKGVWPKMGVDLSNDFDWQFYDCSDGWRYIHTCYAAKNEEGRVVMAIYCKDRMNSANATETTYDCYVLDCNLIEQNADMQNPNAGWSRWAGQGEYCVNTQQIADTLEEAYETYEARWVG